MAEKKQRRVKNPSFGDAVTEVEQILAKLEGEEIDIDDLAQEVKRAVELIKLCRGKLEKTDNEVRDLVADLQPESESAPPARGTASGSDGEDTDVDLPF
ncbi:MAG: exodeoxyribonuclease VII small subunit [bacterium]